MVEQLSVFLENTTGRLAELTRALGDAGLNMRALMVADTSEFGVVRVICDRPHAAADVLENAGFSASLTEVIAVEVPDRPGGLA
ncbi:MAG: ACT domain-containing protein, partial [Coriobacteriales bacterium]